MTPEERHEIAIKAQEFLAKVKAAHTPENLARLRAEVEKFGGKLTGSMRSRSGFTLRFADGPSIAGLSLAAIEDILANVIAKRSLSGRP